MGGFVRKITGVPDRKGVAAILGASSPVQATPPPAQLSAPVISDAAPAAEEERTKNKRQRGRASTIFAGALGDDSQQGGTAKVTLGA